MRQCALYALSWVLAMLCGCHRATETSRPTGQTGTAPASSPSTANAGQADAHGFTLYSDAFAHGQTLPAEFRHTEVGGKNLSPPLRWSNPPGGTQAFVLLCIDPDAPDGDFVHWVLYDLPGHLRQLDRGLGRDATLPNGARQGKNDFGEVGYDGPAPPPGKPHRYIFRLYALDRKLGLPPGATRAEVEKAMHGHILAPTELIGIYQHKP